jgi:hypothetical protein
MILASFAPIVNRKSEKPARPLFATFPVKPKETGSGSYSAYFQQVGGSVEQP